MLKDCNCCTHDGPHWLYMDYLDRATNLRLLERCVNALLAGNTVDGVIAQQAFAQAEVRRLDEKLYHMQANHLDSVSYSLLGVAASANLNEQEQEIRSRLLPVQEVSPC